MSEIGVNDSLPRLPARGCGLTCRVGWGRPTGIAAPAGGPSGGGVGVTPAAGTGSSVGVDRDGRLVPDRPTAQDPSRANPHKTGEFAKSARIMSGQLAQQERWGEGWRKATTPRGRGPKIPR